MEYYKLINKELLKKYGTDLTGKPHYRVVQNGRSFVEKRKGNFKTFYGHIFIREEFGVREVPKYNYVPDGFWILEKLFVNRNEELVDKLGYEPIWVFYGKNGEYQKVNLKACIFLIESALRGPTKETNPLTPEEQIAKETEEFFELLGGKPDLDMAFKSGEAVSFSGLNSKERL